MENKEIIDKLIEVYTTMEEIHVTLRKRHMKSYASDCMIIMDAIGILKRNLLNSDVYGMKIKKILTLRINKTEDDIERRYLRSLRDEVEKVFNKIFTGESKDE